MASLLHGRQRHICYTAMEDTGTLAVGAVSGQCRSHVDMHRVLVLRTVSNLISSRGVSAAEKSGSPAHRCLWRISAVARGCLSRGPCGGAGVADALDGVREGGAEQSRSAESVKRRSLAAPGLQVLAEMYAAINDLEAKFALCASIEVHCLKRIGCHLTAALQAGPVLGGAEEFFAHSLTSEHLMNEPAFYEGHEAELARILASACERGRLPDPISGRPYWPQRRSQLASSQARRLNADANSLRCSSMDPSGKAMSSSLRARPCQRCGETIMKFHVEVLNAPWRVRVWRCRMHELIQENRIAGLSRFRAGRLSSRREDSMRSVWFGEFMSTLVLLLFINGVNAGVTLRKSTVCGCRMDGDDRHGLAIGRVVRCAGGAGVRRDSGANLISYCRSRSRLLSKTATIPPAC